eukprot:2636149-Rhodomonas_salina.1
MPGPRRSSRREPSQRRSRYEIKARTPHSPHNLYHTGESLAFGFARQGQSRLADALLKLTCTATEDKTLPCCGIKCTQVCRPGAECTGRACRSWTWTAEASSSRRPSPATATSRPSATSSTSEPSIRPQGWPGLTHHIVARAQMRA